MKKIEVLLLLICMSIVFASANAQNMFLYETENGYTYVDKEFKPLMDRHFKWAGRFFEGLAVASENGYVGYINTKGNFLIEPEFEYSLPFHYGVAKVWKDGKPYLIDKKGKTLFEHNYRFIKYAIKDSFEPAFIVTTQNWKCGVIDKDGTIIIDTIYSHIQPFCEGLAVVQNGSNFATVNLQGILIVPFGKYSKIGDYNSSRAVVTSKEWNYQTIGVIDNKGNLVFKKDNCDFDWRDYFSSFSDGLIVLRIAGRYQLFDIVGNKIYESNEYISLLKYGYAAVRDTTTYVMKNDIMDKQGKIVCDDADDVIKEKNDLFFVDGATIKDIKGTIVKKENVFVKKQNYNAENYFINKDLVITGKKQGDYMKWYLSSSNIYNPAAGDFSYIDPEGFKDGLLYVMFYDSRYTNLTWGYINEKEEIVYRNRDKKYFEHGIKLNINYMEERGLFDCIDENNNVLKQSINPNKITLLLDSSVYEKTFEEWALVPKRMCHRLRIINEMQDTLLMQDYIHEQIFVQAKDKNGVWRNIQTHIPSDAITDKIYKLTSNKFWEFAIQSYSGGYKTKMRVVVKIPAVYDWKNFKKLSEDKEFISNEIDCEINASQFVRSGFTKDRTGGYYPFEDYVFDRIVTIP